MNACLMALLSVTLGAPPEAAAPAYPAAAPTPLLFLRVLGPEGSNVTFYPGIKGARAYPLPADVGMRAGYTYRLQLSNLPGRPGVKLYPSLEVRGMLQTTLAQAARYPIPLSFTDEELQHVTHTGAMITKVYFLEEPSLAAPIQTTPNEPLVYDVPADTDPAVEARNRGRIMIIVRLGEKEPAAAELASVAVPNTILFPGEQRLGVPPQPPCLPWAQWPVFDPVIGAKRTAEECLPDGGDVGPRLGIGPNGKVGGLNASDSAIEYSTEAGKRKVAPSNRVCLLGPRFAVARQEATPAGVAVSRGLGGMKSTKGQVEARNRIPTGRADNAVMLASTTARQSASGMQSRVALHGYESTNGAKLVATIAGTKVVGTVREPEEITAYPFCEPVSLFKWADPKEAQPGDIVTFYLRYHNHTKQFVENLVVSDSLTSRLEYIAGSARSDRVASLTIQPNEVGSSILRWEISGKLPPGQSGIVAFQARVR